MAINLVGALVESLPGNTVTVGRNQFFATNGTERGFWLQIDRVSQPPTWELWGRVEFQLLTESGTYIAYELREVRFGIGELLVAPNAFIPVRGRMRFHPVPWQKTASLRTAVLVNV